MKIRTAIVGGAPDRAAVDAERVRRVSGLVEYRIHDYLSRALGGFEGHLVADARLGSWQTISVAIPREDPDVPQPQDAQDL